ncbi:G-protein alpha subunit-domain-containing protein [Cantharellus anzutake]|uniref:G-protein alpha subunit-domain-containing protein n=1 Tax=Cantharellus anzutake TaxID=1750568 RepID=UPI001907BD6A|nr:G-protein alpha subunit-domain-containing protein [Cantharellus anzutake]KAF8328661.1 G-protein alpha subunit-domain-containing protein [Cantharellus anzutake]
MGNCCSSTNPAIHSPTSSPTSTPLSSPFSSTSHEKKSHSDSIDRQIAADSRTLRKECKILLLGSGESGKSTIVKQMKILHQGGFNEDELLLYRGVVNGNLVECTKGICWGVERKLGIDKVNPAWLPHIQSILAFEDPPVSSQPLIFPPLPAYLGESIAFLWSDPSIKAIVDERIVPSPSPPSSSDSPSSSSSSVPSSTLRPNSLGLPYSSSSSAGSTSKGGGGGGGGGALIASNSMVAGMGERTGNFYFMDSAAYFLSHARRICSRNYVPNFTDVLRARAQTTGITETKFSMGQLNIHMFDVGGQRSERKKWIHCFESVTSIIFCVALSEYDQPLIENPTQNRMKESLALFDSVVNSRWFFSTSIILFLNKKDVFMEKIAGKAVSEGQGVGSGSGSGAGGRSGSRGGGSVNEGVSERSVRGLGEPLEGIFPEYTGGRDMNKAAKFILWKFSQANRASLTQATDTRNIELVFAAVKETILHNALKDAGIM